MKNIWNHQLDTSSDFSSKTLSVVPLAVLDPCQLKWSFEGRLPRKCSATCCTCCTRPLPAFLLKARLGFCWNSRKRFESDQSSSKNSWLQKSPLIKFIAQFQKWKILGWFCSTLEFMMWCICCRYNVWPHQLAMLTHHPTAWSHRDVRQVLFGRDDLRLEEKNMAFGIKNQALRQTCVYIYIQYINMMFIYFIYTLFFCQALYIIYIHRFFSCGIYIYLYNTCQWFQWFRCHLNIFHLSIRWKPSGCNCLGICTAISLKDSWWGCCFFQITNYHGNLQNPHFWGL